MRPARPQRSPEKQLFVKKKKEKKPPISSKAIIKDRYKKIISLLRLVMKFLCKILTSFSPRVFVLRLIVIGLVVLKKNIKNRQSCLTMFYPFGKRRVYLFERTGIHISILLCQVYLNFKQM